jgi:hypothetical protein
VPPDRGRSLAGRRVPQPAATHTWCAAARSPPVRSPFCTGMPGVSAACKNFRGLSQRSGRSRCLCVRPLAQPTLCKPCRGVVLAGSAGGPGISIRLRMMSGPASPSRRLAKMPGQDPWLQCRVGPPVPIGSVPIPNPARARHEQHRHCARRRCRFFHHKIARVRRSERRLRWSGMLRGSPSPRRALAPRHPGRLGYGPPVPGLAVI